MYETNQPQPQSCSRCRSKWAGSLEYCPNCAQPISLRAKAAQAEESRGCFFFIHVMFGLFFMFVGLALLVVGIAAASHEDTRVSLVFFPGSIMTLASGYAIFRMLRKFQIEKKRAAAELQQALNTPTASTHSD